MHLGRRWLVALVVGLSTFAGQGPDAVAAEKAGLPNPFFAYCVGIGTGKENATLQAQLQLAPMLAEFGYSGMAYVGLNGALDMMKALEQQGVKLTAAYSSLNVDPGKPGFDPQLPQLIPQLKGHDTVVWLTVNSKQYKPSSTDGDDRAVELLRQLAEIAQQSGVSIVLYPHKGCYAQRIEEVVRLAQKTDRPNVGVTFTFCHFLALDDAKNIDHALELAAPYLKMVTINGTSGYDPKNRAGWIQLLGEGSFDLVPVLKKLHQLGYRGPIGFIAFGFKGDRREILSRSMKAWKELSARAAVE